jgi:hypothetical protein
MGRVWSHVRRFTIGAVATASVGALLLGTPAWAALGEGRARVVDRLSPSEARRVERWWDDQRLGLSLALSDMPMGRLRQAAEIAWAAGIPRARLRTALFSDVAREIFAGNAAGGQGRPSPYVEYFTNNPAQLGPLGELLATAPTYVVGAGGTQDQLFAQFEGLRDSYLASLGLVEVNGRIVDPRAPYLTPYLASLRLGMPSPLAQPESALNVG